MGVPQADACVSCRPREYWRLGLGRGKSADATRRA
nr:MAG TPA: hypothetical protein [Caudoviricetes sp.]